MFPVGDKCIIKMSLEGYIDAKKETTRLKDKLEKLLAMMDKGRKAMSIEGYETKVPEDVRAKNAERLTEQENERTKIEDVIRLLETLKH